MELNLTKRFLPQSIHIIFQMKTIVQDILKKGFELMELYYGDSYENLD